MRITTYKTELASDNLPILVKERAVNYQTDIIKFNTPNLIRDLMNNLFSLNVMAEEYLYLLAFNTKQKLIGVFEVAHGSVNAAHVSTRELFIRALLCGAVNIVLVHNHPSGDATPSNEDIELTDKVKQAGDLIGISLVDHIIIGEGDIYCSLYEQGEIK